MDCDDGEPSIGQHISYPARVFRTDAKIDDLIFATHLTFIGSHP